MPIATQEVLEGVWAVKGGPSNAFVVSLNDTAIAIDAGAGEAKMTVALEETGVRADRVSAVFLTHSDRDHAGGLSLFSGARVFLSADEEQMIDGRQARGFLYKNKPLAVRYELVEDGDTLNLGDFEIQVIATPGHTPGSVSYLVNRNLLFTGDAITLKAGAARKFFPPYLNMDGQALDNSLRRLAALENISLLCTAHSGYSADFPAAMKAWRR